VRLKKLGVWDSTRASTTNNHKILHDKNQLEQALTQHTLLSLSHELQCSDSTVGRYARFHGIEYDKSDSKWENLIAHFVEDLGFSVERRVRNVIAPLEIDIWVPAKKLGIECHGWRWHRDERTRHLEKFHKAEATGIQLLQIFDFEFYNKRDRFAWEGLISAKLGVGQKVMARKCDVVALGRVDAMEFHQLFHVLGTTKLSTKSLSVGLMHQGVLVAVGSIDQRFGRLELTRLTIASGYIIVGEARKSCDI